MRHKSLRPAMLGIGAAATAIALAIALAAAPRPQRPNILLITLDTTRADRLGCYGGPSDTPRLDQLAAEGTLFTHAVSAMPATRPAHFAMFTGRFPRQLGTLSNSDALPAEPPTLAAMLREHGYATAAFVSSRVLPPASGVARGFDRFDFPTKRVQRGAQVTVPRALEWLSSAGRGPWFLWVHLFDPHMPYAPPPAHAPRDVEWRDVVPHFTWPALADYARGNGGDLPRGLLDYGKALYAGEVQKTDAWAGRLFDALRARGTLDETVILTVGDHGECFEHGIIFQHYTCLYDGAARVPLLVRYPPRVPRGARRTEAVGHVDLAPTVLELIGVAPKVALSGRPLFANQAPRRWAVTQQPRDAPHPEWVRTWLLRIGGEPLPPLSPARGWALRSDKWKYIVIGEREELYALDADPREEHDVKAQHPDIVAEARAELGRWLHEHPAPPEAPPPALDAGTRETLRKLGYLP